MAGLHPEAAARFDVYSAIGNDPRATSRRHQFWQETFYRILYKHQNYPTHDSDRRIKMKKSSIAVALVCVLALHMPGIGLAQTHAPVMLQSSELHQISTNSGTQFDIYVSFPLGYDSSGDTKYPVFYVTDAKMGFALVTQAYRLMQMGEEVIPVILVGVDTPNMSAPESRASRKFLLTPTRSVLDEKESAARYGAEVQTGGAGAFRSVLKNEIIPWVNERFPTSDVRGLFGYSLGGLFATHVLFVEPELFSHYLIGSPSLWWDDAIIFELEKDYAKEHENLSARAFFSVGAEEYEANALMLPNMLKMVEILRSRNYLSLELTYHIFQGETHSSGAPAAISRGLKFLFGSH